MASSSGTHPGTPRRLVVVAGSGRSGTSTLAGLLKQLGMHVPQPEVAADPSNPKGFGEPQWVVDFHARLLKQAGVRTADAAPDAHRHTAAVARHADAGRTLRTWLDQQLGVSHELVVKDPRLLWFLELWCRTADQLDVPVSFVSMLRAPTEVVRSKATNYGRFSPAVMVAGWINTMLLTERLTRGSDRVFIRYPDLLQDWRVPVFGMARQFGIGTVLDADDERLRSVDGYIDPRLRRSSPTWDGMPVSSDLLDLADDTWNTFTGSAGPIDSAASAGRLDELSARYADAYAELMRSTPYLQVASRIPRAVLAAVPERVQARLARTLRPVLDERR